VFDAVFFDLDGTLVDTESLAIAAGLAAFRHVGHPVETDFLHGLVGKDGPNTYRMILAHRPSIDVVALRAHWSEGFNARLSRGLALKPGVTELLARIVLPRAVVTSSARVEAQRKLDLAGLSAGFATVVTLDDVRAAKPAPDPYLLAAERLAVDPARCLVFEDSDTGAEAAHRAGCTVVQVPDVTATDGRFAHHVAADLMAGARLVGLA
jgi:HAD superfamily hydrolase (TIGR01509 family)